MNRGTKGKDMLGKKVGRWKVIKFMGSQKGHWRWLCRCECGKEKVLSGGGLRRNISTNKGCQSCQVSRQKSTHRMSGTPLYHVWIGMIGRCKYSYKSNRGYYIKTGIKVCDEWKNNSVAFLN